MMPRRASHVLGTVLLLLASAAAGAAQEAVRGDGRLRGLVFDSTTMKPLPGARVVVLGTTVTGWSGDDGRFRLEGIPPGAHPVSFFHPRLQALGVSPVSHTVDFRDGQTSDVTLAVPSDQSLLKAWCLAESRGRAFAQLAGIVRDTLTGVALPRALVTVRPVDPTTGQRGGEALEERADETGYYRFCNVPAGPSLVQGHFGASSGFSVRLDLAPGEPRLQDLGLVLSSVGQLRGQVVDYATGQPIVGASVRLVGSDARKLTVEEGRFTLDSISPGRHVVQTDYLGYATRMDSVTVFSQEAVQVEVKLTTEPIAIEGMVVTARGRIGEALIDLGRRSDYMGPDRIEAVLPRVRDMQDLLEQGDFPALSIREIGVARDMGNAGVPVFKALCIEAVRAMRGDTCRMVAVIVNGMRLPRPEEYLLSLQPQMIESVQYLSPMEATTQFGSGAGSGALLIRTKGGR